MILMAPRNIARRKQKQRGTKPGWFYDPRKESQYRFFDGTAWTDHVSDEFRTEPPDDATA